MDSTVPDTTRMNHRICFDLFLSLLFSFDILDIFDLVRPPPLSRFLDLKPSNNGEQRCEARNDRR